MSKRQKEEKMEDQIYLHLSLTLSNGWIHVKMFLLSEFEYIKTLSTDQTA